MDDRGHESGHVDPEPSYPPSKARRALSVGTGRRRGDGERGPGEACRSRHRRLKRRAQPPMASTGPGCDSVRRPFGDRPRSGRARPAGGARDPRPAGTAASPPSPSGDHARRRVHYDAEIWSRLSNTAAFTKCRRESRDHTPFGEPLIGRTSRCFSSGK